MSFFEENYVWAIGGIAHLAGLMVGVTSDLIWWELLIIGFIGYYVVVGVFFFLFYHKNKQNALSIKSEKILVPKEASFKTKDGRKVTFKARR